MKIDLDGGYVEVQQSSSPDKIFVTVAAKTEPEKNIINSAEITKEQFLALVETVVDIPKPKAKKKKTSKKKTKKKAAKKQVEGDETNNSQAE